MCDLHIKLARPGQRLGLSLGERLDRSTLTYTLITFHVHANQTTERTAFVIYMCNVPAIKHVGACHKTGVRGLNVVKIYI